MNPDSITYLTGAGMVADLFAWFGVALCMVAIAFGLGMWPAQQRKRRVARAAVAMKNWEHWVPIEKFPAIPDTLLANALAYQKELREYCEMVSGVPPQPTAPACGVAKSCNECSTCPDLESK